MKLVLKYARFVSLSVNLVLHTPESDIRVTTQKPTWYSLGQGCQIWDQTWSGWQKNGTNPIFSQNFSEI